MDEELYLLWNLKIKKFRHKVRTPIDEGGLGLRSFKVINKTNKLELCWDLVNEKFFEDLLM